MNGFMLLMLVVLAGQVSPAGPAMQPSSNPVQAASMVATPPPQLDYGWQYDTATKEFQYIVQLSPEKADYMYQNQKEHVSDIPAAVAARINKVVVRIGTKPIDSLPMEQVILLPIVDQASIASNLPTGRIKTLENSQQGDVQSVVGGVPPPSLSPGGLEKSLTDSATSFADRMNEAIRDPDKLLAQSRNSAATNFAQEARTGTSFPTSTAPGMSGSTLSNSIAMPGSNGMPTSTAVTPPAAAGAGVGLGIGTGTMNLGGANAGSNGYGAGVLANGGYNGNAAAGSTNPYGANNPLNNTLNPGATNPGAYGQPHSTAPTGIYTSAPNQNTNASSRGGFGAPPIGASTYPFNNQTNTGQPGTTGYNPTAGYPTSGSNLLPGTPGYQSPNYQTPGYQAPGYQTPNYQNPGGTNYAATGGSPYIHSDPPSIRLGDQRGGIPGTGSPSNLTTTNNSGRSGWSTRTDGYPDGELNNALAGRSGVENIMPVMFVLSLVVNFYLGMLIRKLLGRYRTLLSSVRSQTV